MPAYDKDTHAWERTRGYPVYSASQSHVLRVRRTPSSSETFSSCLHCLPCRQASVQSILTSFKRFETWKVWLFYALFPVSLYIV